MNPDTARKAIRRSILKQEGVKRIEVVLDRFDADQLFAWAKDSDIAVSEAVRIAVSDALKARGR